MEENLVERGELGVGEKERNRQAPGKSIKEITRKNIPRKKV